MDLMDRSRALLYWDAVPLEALRKECALQGLREEVEPLIGAAERHEERRTCPEDGDEYSYLELVATYGHIHSEVELQCYWQDACVPVQHATKGDAKGGGEDAEQAARRVLEERLLPVRTARFYEALGLPVSRIGSLGRVIQLANQYTRLDAMDMKSLAREYRQSGLPSMPKCRGELLRRLRCAALWAQLPFAELRREWHNCAPRLTALDLPIGVPSQRGGEVEQRRQLLELLYLSLCAEEWVPLGLPSRRLESLQAVARLAERWDRLGTMSLADLAREASAMGMDTAGLSQDDLRDRLRTAATWTELAFGELQKECRVHDINSIARPDQRPKLLEQLLFACRWKTLPRAPPKAAHEDSGRQSASQPPPKPEAVSGAVTGFFEVLQLDPRTAGPDAVRKAFRRLALKYHPDKNQESSKAQATKAFRDVLEAYEALCRHFAARGCR